MKTVKTKAYGLLVKRIRFGDEKIGDITAVYMERRIANMNRNPHYHSILPVTLSYQVKSKRK